jgi:hypothetical protein
MSCQGDNRIKNRISELNPLSNAVVALYPLYPLGFEIISLCTSTGGGQLGVPAEAVPNNISRLLDQMRLETIRSFLRVSFH